jgi:phosphoglycerate dehydrogenase-like enzyme
MTSTPQTDRRTKVAVLGSLSPENRARVQEVASDADLVFADTIDQIAESIAEFDAVGGHVPATALQRASRLRWVHTWAAGPDADLFPEMMASPVVLTSSVGNGAVPLAEHSILLMLMLNRDVPRWMRAQSDHRWDRHTHGELKDLTLGIFGLGHSGADLAAKAKAFHMRVLGMRRHADRPVPGVDQLFRPEQLHEFLSECDFVVVTAPATEETRGTFDEAAFKAMKPTAFWICISRGGIADDAALLKALQEGWIAGAGLDAHGQEPLPADSPFWDLGNVIITPHNGATTAATAQRGVEYFIENLGRFLRGEALVNVVDKAAGY